MWHVNGSGEVGPCGAQPGNCPFSQGFHFATEAQAGAMAERVSQVLAANYRDLLDLRMNQHRHIIETFQDRERRAGLQAEIDLRARMDELLARGAGDLEPDPRPWRGTWSPSPSIFPTDPDRRQGWDNELEDMPSQVLDTLATMGRTWSTHCNGRELEAIRAYALDAGAYAEAMANGAPGMWENLHSALAKAPVTSPGFLAWSGVNGHHVGDILSQAQEGEVVLSRALSASVNPAQVNGFATGERTLALEVLAHRGASMMNFSRNPQELEVLLPPGRYRVRALLGPREFLWGAGVGRTMDQVLQLEAIA